MKLQKIGWEGVEWANFAPNSGKWRTVVTKVMNFLIP